MLYKTIYFSGNPSAEYQKRGGVWYKRTLGSREVWYKVDPKGAGVLNNAYKSKNPLYYYSNTVLIGGVALIGALGYLAYKRYGKTPIV